MYIIVYNRLYSTVQIPRYQEYIHILCTLAGTCNISGPGFSYSNIQYNYVLDVLCCTYMYMYM